MSEREAVAAMKNRKLLDEALANSEPEPPFVHLPGCISAEQMMLSRTLGGERYCMWCEPCNMAWNAAIDAAREAVVALTPRLKVEKYEGGYDCCGCLTTYDLMEDALAAIDALLKEQT